MESCPSDFIPGVDLGVQGQNLAEACRVTRRSHMHQDRDAAVDDWLVDIEAALDDLHAGFDIA